MKNILVSVVGVSPQVVTETLYALHIKNEWVEEIKVITTTVGKEKIENALLTKGILAEMCIKLGRPLPSFTTADIWVIPNSLGEPVSDARSEADHEALANFITTKVRDLTEDNQVSVHASIAGGRKTMTFYLGYAMSLFGRSQDRMSHVLVTDGYESHPDFFYPCEGIILHREKGELDTSKAEVTLSYIPFIRQRELLPKLLTSEKGPLDFKKLVDLINLASNPEQLRIKVHFKKYRVDIYHANNPEQPQASVVFNNGLEWCFYWLLLEATKENDSSYVRTVKIGKAEKSDASKFDSEQKSLAKAVLNQVCDLMGIKCPKLGISIAELVEYLLDNDDRLARFKIPESGLNSMYHGLEGVQFDTLITNIKKELEQELPAELVTLLVPGPLFSKNGDYSSSRKRNGGYAISLPYPDQQIELLSLT